MLSGKYRPGVDAAGQDGGRLKATAAMATPALSRTRERHWRIVAELESVARAVGRPMAQVAVNWVANRPAVASVVLGATRVAQLEDTLAALDFQLPAELEARLDAAGALPAAFPYTFIDAMAPRVHGPALVSAAPPRQAEAPHLRSGGWGSY